MRWRLPMLVMGLIMVALGAFLWAAFAQMERTLLDAGRTRAQSAADQLVGLMAPPIQQRVVDMKRVASHPSLRAYFVAPGDATDEAARSLLRSLVTSGRQVIELWDRSGNKVLSIAEPADAASGYPPSAAPSSASLRLAREGNGPVVSDMIEAVPAGAGDTSGSPLGFVVVRRAVAGTSPEVLNRLLGDGAQLHVGGSQSQWTDLISIIPPSTLEAAARPGVGEYKAANGEARLGAIAQIRGTPWFVSVGFPRATFLAPATTFLYRTSLIGLLIALVAGVVTRIATARITTPLRDLTVASEAIAGGDFDHRVKTGRSDEIGRLGHAFNSMVSQIQAAHEHLVLAVRGSNVGIWEWNAGEDRMFVSMQWKQLLGYSDEEFSPDRHEVIALVHPDDRDGVTSGIKACLDGETDHWESEHRLLRKDGSLIWVVTRGVASRNAQGRPTRFAGTSIDITTQKLARDQAVLQARQAAFVADVAVALTEGGKLPEMLAKCAQAMIEHLDASLARIWMVSTTEPVLELQAAAGPVLPLVSRVNFGEFPVGTVAERRQPLVDNAVDPVRYRFETADASLRRSYAGFPLMVGDRLVGVMSMFSNRTLTDSTLTSLAAVARTIALGIERVRLDDTRARFEALLESATDFVTIGRLSGPPLYINRAARQALGIGTDEKIDSLFQFRTPEFASLFEKTIVPVSLRDGLWKGRAEFVSRSGRVIPVSQVSILHKDAVGNVQYLSTIARDISDELRAAREREQMDDQLRRTQKIEAVGQLAGGLAHDFNNLLTIILGYANVLADQFDDEDPRRMDLEQIRRAGDRASQLTRQLLAFSRKQILNPIVINPNELIQGVLPMLSRLLGEAVDVVLDLDPDVSAIKFDPTQMELILVNLAVNARDAMPEGGRLTIDTADTELDDEFCRTHLSVEPGHYVRISVTDTGVGIDDATKQRIFEPFFTTKARDKGTGLGLATVFGIVKQSGGSVWVYSEPGLGASFKIFLPASRADKPVTTTRSSHPAATGRETVLVVEDEPGVRLLVETILKRAGYTVLSASHPKEAIRMAADTSQPIDLLITDVVMPDLHGSALAAELFRTRPSMRVLFMSGFADEAIEHLGVLQSGAAFLQKPFTGSEIANKVRAVLDQKQPATSS